MRAYRVFDDGRFGRGRFCEMSPDELDQGEVIVRIAYASVNYKDALTAYGKARIALKFPVVAGIDLAGVVESSADPRFKAGDEVIVHSNGLGADHDGGYAEMGRFPGDWVIPLPAGMTLYESSALGVAGHTAALAIDLMAQRGYQVVAMSGKPEQAEYLRMLGASEIVGRADVAARERPLEAELWAGAVDSLGGAHLPWIARRMRRDGVIAAFGNAAGADFQGSVLPYILRGVRLIGVNVNNPFETMRRVWGRLAGDLRPRHLHRVARRIRFEELEKAFDGLLAGEVTGRMVVDFSLR